MKVYIAREKDGKLSMFSSLPGFRNGFWWGKDMMDISSIKHTITWEQSPQQVSLRLINKSKNEK
jgi:hypothetical protein